MAKSTLNPGDRIAYAAKFLKSTGQQVGPAGSRRGTFLRADDGFAPGYARVMWDDFEAGAPALAEQYGADYVDDARANGQVVFAGNIARVGSARFACNDL